MMQTQANRGASPATDWQGILGTLDDLCRQCCNVLKGSRVSKADAQKLLDYVTNVRMLLTELNQIEGRANSDERRIAAIQELQRRYGELEDEVRTGSEATRLA